MRCKLLPPWTCCCCVHRFVLTGGESLAVLLCRRIRPYELLEQRWMGSNKERDAAGILATITRFNRVSSWVKTLITTSNAVERADLLDHFLAIADVRVSALRSRPGPAALQALM